jgi:hypothetical protein
VICQDCAGAADELLKPVERANIERAAGHDRCVARNLGAVRGSEDCACQHRPAGGVSGG